MLYLPLVVLGTLALATYWLIRSTPTAIGAADARPESHEPDYFMERFSVRTFDSTGRIRSEVIGEKARHFPDTKWMEIDRIHIRSFDTSGRLTRATAQRGLTNDDASEVQLIGNAVVIRDADAVKSATSAPRMEYRSEFLHAFMTTERVTSNKPVELLRGNDRFTADSLEFDNVEQVLQLKGRVRGTLVQEQK